MRPHFGRTYIILLLVLMNCRLHWSGAEDSDGENWEVDVQEPDDEEASTSVEDEIEKKIEFRTISPEEALEMFDEFRDELIVKQMLVAIYADDTRTFAALINKYGTAYVNATYDVDGHKEPIVLTATLCARLGIVKLLVTNGADVNAYLAESGYGLLDFAVQRGYVALAEWLLDNGAKSALDLSDNKGTLLHVAAVDGNAAMMEMLLRRGAWDLEARDPEFATALHRASAGDDAMGISSVLTMFHEKLLRKYPGAVNFPANPADLYDPLAVTKELIAAGADVNSLDANNEDPIRRAMRAGRFDIAELLLKGGADPLIWDGKRISFDAPPPGASGKHRKRFSEVAERRGYGQGTSGMLKMLRRLEDSLKGESRENRKGVVSDGGTENSRIEL